MGGQLGKTDGILLNTIGWKMMDNPAPSLFYMPTEKAAADISKDRLSKMFRSVPELWAAIDHKSKTIFEFFINGVRFGLGWGGSKTQVASFASALTCFDEIDRIDDIPGEGNPYELTKVRGSTYSNSCQISTSTPTLGSVEEETHPDTGLIHWQISDNVYSLSWTLWQEGTRHEFMLPCPHCKKFFTPKSKLLSFDKRASIADIERNTALLCPHCEKKIDQNLKSQMVLEGRMIAPGQFVIEGKVSGPLPDNKIYSAYVNGLCSPWKSWGQRAADLTRASRSGDKGRVQVVFNTHFGELYDISDQGKAPKKEVIQSKYMENYKLGEIPEETEILTAGVDVQKNRLVVVVMGWKNVQHELEASLVMYQEILGETSQNGVWEELKEQYLEKRFEGHVIHTIAIDTGYNPTSGKEEAEKNIIYAFCRTHHHRCVATKGNSRPSSKPFSMTKVDVNWRGNSIKNGLSLWKIDTNFYKGAIYSRLKWPLDEPGRWHFPHDTPLQFFKELTAERLTEAGEWIKKGENHVLDCMVLNLFLSEKLKVKNEVVPQKKEPPRIVQKGKREEGW